MRRRSDQGAEPPPPPGDEGSLQALIDLAGSGRGLWPEGVDVFIDNLRKDWDGQETDRPSTNSKDP